MKRKVFQIAVRYLILEKILLQSMMLKEVREPIFARINLYREYYLQSDVSKSIFI